MPNLGKIIEDESERKRSIERMLSDNYARVEVRANHGIRDQGELQTRVCAAPFEANQDDERTAAFGQMLGV